MTTPDDRTQPAGAGVVRCAACGAQLPGRDPARSGRNARYCSGSCKAKAYRARRNAARPGTAGTAELPAAARHARAIEIRQQITQLTANLADAASGQQELFASPGASRAARPTQAAQTLHELITELATLATTAAVTKRVTFPPRTTPLFGHPGNPRKDLS